MKNNLYNYLILTLLLGLGFYLRTALGLYWDESELLHPDERFLTMVVAGISLPKSLAEYFNSGISPLNPYNNNFHFYVYGTLPIFITKIIALLFSMDGYGSANIVGRVLAGVIDLGSIIMVFLIGTKLYNRSVGLIAAALLAFSVQNIQLAHFLGTENFVGFFVALTFYLAIYTFSAKTKIQGLLLALATGIAWGLALSSKVSGVFFALPLLLFALQPLYLNNYLQKTSLRALIFNSVQLFILSIFAFLIFRIFQPYAFAGPGFFNFSLAPKFLSNMEEITRLTNGGDIPPAVQWVNRAPLLYSFQNMLFWYMGLAWGMTTLAGVVLCAYEITYKKIFLHIPLLAWAVFWFVYQSTRFVQYGRYLSIAYPFFAIIAAYFIYRICLSIRNKFSCSEKISYIPAYLVIGFSFLWAIAFTNIYRTSVTRLAASRWMYANIPCETVLANEHWDDSLPMRVDGKDGFGNCYKGVEFHHFDNDTQEKLADTLKKLEQTEYIILSSNRVYNSIPRLPRRFPFTIDYYKKLFSGVLGFELVKTFTSYPNIFGIEFNTDNAEEAFSVYDHPKVLIFKKTKYFNLENLREIWTPLAKGVMEPLR